MKHTKWGAPRRCHALHPGTDAAGTQDIPYTDKAAQMSAATQMRVARRGMVFETKRNGEKRIPEEADNDSLWIGMHGVGSLCAIAC